MKTILVTGTNGFIGKNLVKKLNDKFSILSINEDIFNKKNWQSYLQNFLLKNKINGVFHVGAVSNTLEKNVNFIMIRNCEFTDIISQYCAKNKIPLIYSSSAANYGIDGKTPSNLYGWSKYIGEKIALLNGGVALRYYNVYGPGEEDKGKMASIAYQMWKTFNKGKAVKIFPNKPKRDFIYIDDVISANINAFENFKKIKGNYFDVGTGKANTFEKVLELLEIKFTYMEESDIPNGYQFFTQANSNKFLPGWTPKYDIKTGINCYKEYLNK